MKRTVPAVAAMLILVMLASFACSRRAHAQERPQPSIEMCRDIRNEANNRIEVQAGVVLVLIQKIDKLEREAREAFTDGVMRDAL